MTEPFAGYSGAAHTAKKAPEALALAIRQFNAQAFFDCHETLECLWLAAKQASAHEPAQAYQAQFYQGLLFTAVGLYHAQQGNVVGAYNLTQKALNTLAPLQHIEPVCHWLDLLGLQTQNTQNLAVFAQHVSGFKQQQPSYQNSLKPLTGYRVPIL